MRKPPNEGLTAGEGRQKPRSFRAKSSGVDTKSERTPFDFAQDEREIGGQHTPERKCILSGAHGERGRLIRLAVGPDGAVAPDVRARAPGRGAWIGVDRATLEAAQAKGKLKGALARAFKSGEVSAPADLGERIAGALRQAALDRLGLEARAGMLISGSDKIETAARRGEIRLLIHAADAGEDGNRKLDQALRVGADGSGGETLVFPEGRAILSMALGRQNVVHIAIIDRAAASRVRLALDRWRNFIGPDGGFNAGAAGTPDAPVQVVNEG